MCAAAHAMAELKKALAFCCWRGKIGRQLLTE
jgi:hypothetical protein